MPYTINSYCNFDIPKVKPEKAKQSFLLSGAKVWNELQDQVKRSQSIEIFQDNMKKYLFIS